VIAWNKRKSHKKEKLWKKKHHVNEKRNKKSRIPERLLDKAVGSATGSTAGTAISESV